MGLARPFEETQPADAGQRERALDAAQSFLVDAPAGSGKTELLIQRYLKLLALVEAPEAVVAITFTVKAAAEMRTRVLEALARAAGEARPDSSHEALTWDLAAAVLERDRERRWDLRDHPARLRVQTIDALCASITRQMPWLSRFGAQPQVTEQAEELYREAARNLVARLPDPLVVLLERLDNQVPALTELLVGMLARRDQWLRHVMRGTAREELESALRAVIREELSGLCRSVPAEWTDELLDLARFAAANLRDSGRESDLAACHEMTELPGARPEDVAVWRGIAALLLKANGDWRARPDVRTGFPSDQKEAKRRYEEMLGEFCRGHEEFREALKKLKWLPDASYDAGQWRAMEALFELLPVAVAELQVVFAERGVVDFAEVALRASLALGTEEQPTDLALALDYRIQHLLVDEFQDTSLSQYRLLRLLTAGWERGDGRTLFLVGDPMQSIYRFREAEVGLFLRARREGIGTVALEPLRLTVNFRSQAGIVGWVNRAFAEVFPSREEIATGAVTYSPSVAQRADEGMEGGAAVEVHPLFGRDAATEAALVLELVRSARVEHPRGKTAILARARTHLPRILRVLEEAGLRYRAIEIDELSARPLIQDLLALTRALVHAGDRTAWLAVLRAPWCGLTLADLDALAGTNPYAAVWELLADESRLSADGQARLRRVRGVLAESLQLTRRVPLRSWVEGTWVRLGGPACLRNRTDEEDARGFFQLLDAVEEGGEAPDPHVLAERVERLFAAPDLEADESLQVLTIHKAKGLEFDTVIVPGLGRIPPVDDARLLAWLETTTSEGDSLLLLAPVKAAGMESDQTGRYLRRMEQQKEMHEAVRLLYVAATRARRKLHLLGDVPLREKDGVVTMGNPESGSLLARLWPVVEDVYTAAFAERAEAAAAEARSEPREAVIRRLPATWTLPDAPAAVVWRRKIAPQIEEESEEPAFDWAGEMRRHVGTVVHRLLRQIAEDGVERWDAAVVHAALAGLGVSESELDKAAADVERALTATLSDPRGRWILSREHSGARCEYPLTGLVNGRLVAGVIDRTFVDEAGTRWIIDYKTGSHQGANIEAFLDAEQDRYQAQLSDYAALFQELENRPIRLALYFPLLTAWRELPHSRQRPS